MGRDAENADPIRIARSGEFRIDSDGRTLSAAAEVARFLLPPDRFARPRRAGAASSPAEALAWRRVSGYPAFG